MARVNPQKAGFNPEALEAALNYAAEHNTVGLVILYKGRLLTERYWEFKKIDPKGSKLIANWTKFYVAMQAGKDALGHPIEDVASVQKSLIASLAYIAHQKGLLNFDEPVTTYLGSGWTNAPAENEKEIKIKHLLNMTSGLNPKLEYQAKPGEKRLTP